MPHKLCDLQARKLQEHSAAVTAHDCGPFFRFRRRRRFRSDSVFFHLALPIIAITPSFAADSIIQIMDDGLMVLDNEGLIRVADSSFGWNSSTGFSSTNELLYQGSDVGFELGSVENAVMTDTFL